MGRRTAAPALIFLCVNMCLTATDRAAEQPAAEGGHPRCLNGFPPPPRRVQSGASGRTKTTGADFLGDQQLEACTFSVEHWYDEVHSFDVRTAKQGVGRGCLPRLRGAPLSSARGRRSLCSSLVSLRKQTTCAVCHSQLGHRLGGTPAGQRRGDGPLHPRCVEGLT